MQRILLSVIAKIFNFRRIQANDDIAAIHHGPIAGGGIPVRVRKGGDFMGCRYLVMDEALMGRALGHTIFPLTVKPVLFTVKREPGSSGIHEFDRAGFYRGDEIVVLLLDTQAEGGGRRFQIDGDGNGLEGIDKSILRDVVIDAVVRIKGIDLASGRAKIDFRSIDPERHGCCDPQRFHLVAHGGGIWLSDAE